MCTSYCYATVICLYLDHFHLYRGCSFRCSSSCCCCWNDTSGCCDVRSRRFLNFTRICRKVTWVQNIYVICISDAVNASKSVLHPLVRQRHSSSKLHSGSVTLQPPSLRQCHSSATFTQAVTLLNHTSFRWNHSFITPGFIVKLRNQIPGFQVYFDVILSQNQGFGAKIERFSRFLL